MYSRRLFIKHHTWCGLGLLTGSSAVLGQPGGAADIQFISPIDGDILHNYDGVTTDAFLKTQVKIAAPANSLILINGIPAKESNDVFIAAVSLTRYKNIIEVTDKKSGITKSITVYWFKKLADKYRLSIDDAIWFLK